MDFHSADGRDEGSVAGILGFFLLAQRRIVSGLTAGAVKG